MSGITSALNGWMVTPWMFLAGAALVAAPIIIHLLNKRKFKTVDWAAMDFLIEAEKKNHRRIRLENLILLLLRCLAVMLIGLLLARPFLPSHLTAGLLKTARYERIVLLDDSLSMEVAEGGMTAFDVAKKSLSEFVGGLAANTSDDSLTLILVSRPDQPVFNAAQVTEQTQAEIADEIRELTTTDRPVNLESALLALEKSLAGAAGDVNRVVYVVGDLRLRDWGEGQARGAVVETLGRIAGRTAGAFVADVGSDNTDNLTVVAINPREKALVAGVAAEFEVVVQNNGLRDAANVPVRFTAGDALPQEGEIASIPAGKTASIPFSFTFARLEDVELTSDPDPVRIGAEIPLEGAAAGDRLLADNARFFAARVRKGVPILIVDGDPSAEWGRSETFYLERALAPPGDYLTGNSVKVVTYTEFQDVRLSDFQVIYICNLYTLFPVEQEDEPAGEGSKAAADRPPAQPSGSPGDAGTRLGRLREWVDSGGSLVVFAGDQIDIDYYNDHLYRDGNGLLPARLLEMRGDESERQWAHIEVEADEHPVFQLIGKRDAGWGQEIKVFRWWGASVPEQARVSGQINVLASLTDQEDSPLIVEKPLGRGRVMFCATSCDADWTDWPSDYVRYIVVMNEMNRYLIPRTSDRGTILVGQPVVHPVDLTRYRIDGVTLAPPEGEKIPIQPVRGPVSQGNAESRESGILKGVPRPSSGDSRNPDSEVPAGQSRVISGADESLWHVQYEETDHRGFYELTLTRIPDADSADGEETEKVLFAANVDPSEGDLVRVETAPLQEDLGERVQIVEGEALLSLGGDEAKGELWLYVLLFLGAVLFTELFLAWLFGTRR